MKIFFTILNYNRKYQRKNYQVMDIDNLLQNIFNPRLLLGNPSSDDFSKPSDVIQQLLFQHEIYFDKTSLASSIQDYKTTSNIKNLLANIQFKYTYNSEVLIILSNNSFEPNEFLISLLYFELFACIKNQIEIENSDFYHFLLILNNIMAQYKIDFINFLFKILMETFLQQTGNKWTNDNIKLTNSFFINNSTLSSQFFPIFIQFSQQAFNQLPNIKNYMLAVLSQFVDEKRSIMENAGQVKSNFRGIFQILDAPVQDLSQEALSIIIYLSFYEKDDDNSFSFDEFLQSIPQIFASKMLSVHISVDYEKVKIHDCQATIDKDTETYLLSQKVKNDDDVFKGIIEAPPAELVQTNENFTKTLKELFDLSRLFQYFLENLNPVYYQYFLARTMTIFTQKQSNRNFNSYTALMMILKAINDKDSFDQYLKQLFDDVLFDPETTVYGPYSLSPQINFIRGEIVKMMVDKSPASLFLLLNTYEECPFLFAEIIGRYYYLAPLEYLVQPEYYSTISHVGKLLRAMKASRACRSTIISIIGLYLSNPKSSLSCLSSPDFVHSFFDIIVEKSLIKTFLFSILANSLVNLKEINTIQPTRDYLLNASSSKFFSCDIFQFVHKVCSLRPHFVRFFEPFLEKMIKDLDKNSNELNAKTTFGFLLLVSQFTFHYFGQSKSILPVLAKNVKFIDESVILNLIAASRTINKTSLFLFKRPFFLPLLFAKLIGNFDETIKFLLKLAEYSDYNCRALHDGKIDLLLLNILAGNPTFVTNGFELDLEPFVKNGQSQLSNIITLLKLICISKSSGEVASLFTKIITKSQCDNKNSIIKLLSCILLTLSNEPKIQFPIGDIDESCTVTGFRTSFKPEFTFQFRLKIDNGFFSRSKSTISLISIKRKSVNLSISLINGALYAVYLNKNHQTIVILSSKFTNNNWYTFTILFNKETNENGYRIITYRNYERLHDSDFVNIDLNQGPITLSIGGYQKGPLSFTGEQCGRISNIILYNRLLTRKEVEYTLSNIESAPSDYFFSTLHGLSNARNTFHPRQFQIMGIDQLTVNLFTNSIDIEKLDSLIPSFSFSFIVSLIMHKSNEYWMSISSLLSCLLRRITDENLSIYFASLLFAHKELISFELFTILESTISQIELTTIRFNWLEDVIFNFNIYNDHPIFQSILIHLSHQIRQYTHFFKTKFYFSYFLPSFNSNINNAKLTDDFSLFLARLSRIHLSSDDCDLLMLYTFNSTIENQLVYLTLIYQMEKSMLKIKYPIDQKLISLLRQSTSVDVIVHVLLCLSSVTQDRFHSLVPFLVEQITDKESVLAQLEQYVSQNNDLFSLSSALALVLEKEDLHSIPRYPLTNLDYVDNQHFLWFVFPIVYAIQPKTHEKTRNGIFNYISSKCVYSANHKNVDYVLLFLSYLSAFTKSGDFNPLNEMLVQMNEKSIVWRNMDIKNPTDLMFSILFNSLWPIFFHFNDNRHSKLMDDFSEFFKVTEVAKESIEKISLKSIDDLMKLIKSFSLQLYCHPEIDETVLILYAKTICDSFLVDIQYPLPQNPYKLTINDLNQFLGIYKSEFEKGTSIQLKSIKQVEQNTLIFDWIYQLLKSNFIETFNVLQSQFNVSIPEDSKPIDNSYLNNFQLFEQKRILETFIINQNELYERLKKENKLITRTIQRFIDFPNLYSHSFQPPLKPQNQVKQASISNSYSYEMKPNNSLILQQELNLHLLVSHQQKYALKLIYSSVLKSSKYPNTFSLLFNSRDIVFFYVQFDNSGNAKINRIAQSFLKPMKNEHWRFDSFDNGILLYNGSDLLTSTPLGTSEQENIFLERPLFSNKIFLRTPSIISRSLIDSTQQNYLNSYKDIYIVKHTVICLAMNERHNIFVVGCDDYKIRIRNLDNGKKMSTVCLDNELPLHILITEKCGLVIVKTKSFIWIITAYGELLHKQPSTIKIGKWTSFVTQDEMDCVILEEADNHKLHYFEVTKNDPKDRRILSVIDSDILVIHFDQENNCFIVVTKKGWVSILPRL